MTVDFNLLHKSKSEQTAGRIMMSDSYQDNRSLLKTALFYITSREHTVTATHNLNSQARQLFFVDYKCILNTTSV